MARLPARARVALLLVLLVAFASLAATARGIWRAWAVAPAVDEITALDRRLAPVRGALGGQSEIGYIGPRADLSGRHLAHSWRFVVTCYALAPALVYPDRTHALVLADLGSDAAGREPLPAGLELVRDLGDGLLLLRARQ